VETENNKMECRVVETDYSFVIVATRGVFVHSPTMEGREEEKQPKDICPRAVCDKLTVNVIQEEWASNSDALTRHFSTEGLFLSVMYSFGPDITGIETITGAQVHIVLDESETPLLVDA